MKIIPLADRVVIKTVEVEETTKGGLILTGSAKEKPQVAQVVAVGPGGVVDGKEVKMLSLIHIYIDNNPIIASCQYPVYFLCYNYQFCQGWYDNL